MSCILSSVVQKLGQEMKRRFTAMSRTAAHPYTRSGDVCACCFTSLSLSLSLSLSQGRGRWRSASRITGMGLQIVYPQGQLRRGEYINIKMTFGVLFVGGWSGNTAVCFTLTGFSKMSCDPLLFRVRLFLFINRGGLSSSAASVVRFFTTNRVYFVSQSTDRPIDKVTGQLKNGSLGEVRSKAEGGEFL
ncbi:hypothetical protein LX36DRAFT_102585 [Colletotrichum falcatum]|nr:hypothetical protein LX36DRAFT_102585 [Colletotrichum falcatum]